MCNIQPLRFGIFGVSDTGEEINGREEDMTKCITLMMKGETQDLPEQQFYPFYPRVFTLMIGEEYFVLVQALSLISCSVFDLATVQELQERERIVVLDCVARTIEHVMGYIDDLVKEVAEDAKG